MSVHYFLFIHERVILGVFTPVFDLCIEGEYCPWERERLSGVWLDEEEAGFVEGSTAPDDNRWPYFVLLHYLKLV